MIRIKINVKCPNNAHKNVERLADAILLAKKPVKQKIVNDKLFYWIIDCKDFEELSKYTARCLKAENKIKEFYKVLFKLIKRANKLANKWKKGISWIRYWMIKRIRKIQGGNQASDMENKLNQMDDKELKDFINPKDKDMMTEFLKQDLITIDEIKS